MGSQTDTTHGADEEVLADPGSHTVEQVVAVLSRSTPGQIEAAKALEAEGQARKGIAEFELPQETPPANEPTFSRERVLDREEGPRIVGASHPAIVGALHDDDTEQFTRAQITRKVEEFLARPVEQEA